MVHSTRQPPSDATSRDVASALARYTPEWVRRALHDTDGVPAPRRVHMAVLFADISGFTALSEQLAREGPAGAERLSSILNETFEDLVEAIARAGGDTLKFAGDALLAVWPADGEILEEPVRRAARCALALRDLVHNRAVGDGTFNATLSIKVGVSAGEVWALHAGGVAGRRELIVAGPPLDEMSEAEHQAERGDVVLGPTCMMLCGEHFRGKPTGAGCFVLDTVTDPLPLVPATNTPVDEAATDRLRGYVPEAVLARFDAGQGEWLAELRRVSVVFISIAGIDARGDQAPEQLNGAMRACQEAVLRAGGQVNKLLTGDKGTTVLAAFGLPPQSHEDDARRALVAAADARARLQAMGLDARAGVTTGRVFCGPAGGLRRREYTILGDVVNTAARLMQAAVSGDASVLCDEATARATQDKLELERGDALTLKGKRDPVPTWRLVGGAAPIARERQAAPSTLVGRERERQVLIERLEAARGGSCELLLVEGEAGVGKSSLVRTIHELASERDMAVLASRADALEPNTPLYVWQGAFRQLLLEGDERLQDVAFTPRVVPALRSLGVDVKLGALMNALLATDVPENAASQALMGRARFTTTAEIAERLLVASRPGPKVVVLEDGHWFDTTSWELLARFLDHLEETLFVVTTRPIAEPPLGLSALLGRRSCHQLKLGALDRAGSDALIAARLGVGWVPAEVLGFIFDRAQGNPFFTEEMTFALRDAGALVARDGRAELAPGTTTLEAVEMPENVEGVVTQRIDRLDVGEQLALKTASVIGRRFWVRAVRDIYPVEGERPRVDDWVHRLDTVGLTRSDASGPGRETSSFVPEAGAPREGGDENTRVFRHAITRDVAYQMMLFAQRRQLHRAIGEWVEETFAETIGHHFPVLAHHFAEAGVKDKALTYLDGSGQWAIIHDANANAVELLERAIALDTPSPDDTPEQHLARARRLRMLGEAEMGRGNVGAAPDAFKRALGHLGSFSGTPSPSRVKRTLAKQILVHLALRVHNPRAQGFDREVALEFSRVGFRMAQCFYYANYMVSALTAGLIALNHAMRVGPSRELVQSAAAMAIAAGLVPLHAVARHFSRLARTLAPTLDDRAADAYATFSTSIYTLGTGAFDEANADLERALAIYEEVDERKDRLKAENLRAQSAFYQADWDDALTRFRRVEASARRVGDRQQQAWGHLGQGMLLFRRGDTDACLTQLGSTMEMLAETHDRSAELICRGIMAACRLLRGDVGEADKETDRAVRLIHELDNPTVVASTEGYVCTAYVTAARLRDGAPIGPMADDALKAMKRCANVFPLARPGYLMVLGCMKGATKGPAAAVPVLNKAIAASTALAMPWEAAFGTLELARWTAMGGDLENAAERLADAKARFEAIGADGLAAVTARVRDEMSPGR